MLIRAPVLVCIARQAFQNDHDSPLMLDSSEQAWANAEAATSKFQDGIKKQLTQLAVRWMIKHGGRDKETARKDAQRIVDDQVTCGHLQPYLYASTLTALREGTLPREDRRTGTALDRSGDMVASFIEMMRRPNKQKLQEMKTVMEVKLNPVFSDMLCMSLHGMSSNC